MTDPDPSTLAKATIARLEQINTPAILNQHFVNLTRIAENTPLKPIINIQELHQKLCGTIHRKGHIYNPQFLAYTLILATYNAYLGKSYNYRYFKNYLECHYDGEPKQKTLTPAVKKNVVSINKRLTKQQERYKDTEYCLAN